MDAPTVIALLALHILVSGWLLHMVGRTMADGGGLRDFANGSLIFGVAYVGRLALGLTSPHPMVVVLDILMVAAVLMFASGMRRFFGSAAWALRTSLTWAAAFGGLQALLLWQGGSQPRHIMLNATLGVCYLTLAWGAARPAWGAGREGAQPAHPDERVPALLLGALVGALGLASVARAGHVAAAGTGVLYQGAAAQVYFAYSSIAAMTLCPLVLWLAFRRLTRQLADLATHDALTRVLNRNGLEEALQRHFGRREEAVLTWLVVDIDHFKLINDRHGHGAGDEVLRAVAQALLAHVRSGDFVARTGGEEFVIGCASAEAATAARLAERLRSEVQALRVPVRAQPEPLRCTTSIGLSAPFHTLRGWEVALGQADAALYRAKAAGRNRVEGPQASAGHVAMARVLA